MVKLEILGEIMGIRAIPEIWCNRLLIHDGATRVRGPSERLTSAGYCRSGKEQTYKDCKNKEEMTTL